MSRKAKGLETTYQVRLYPTPEQSRLRMVHCIEYISTVNVVVQAIDADMLEDGLSTKDCTARLPSAVKNQTLRDARSVQKRSLAYQAEARQVDSG
jgi:putative transposase